MLRDYWEVSSWFSIGDDLSCCWGFVCFNHSAITLTRAWQYPNFSSPPDSRLGGGDPPPATYAAEVVTCGAFKY